MRARAAQAEGDADDAACAANLLLFGRLLRGAGPRRHGRASLDALAGRSPWSDMAAGRDVHHGAAGHCWCSRREDLALFDAAFDAFWRDPAEGGAALDLAPWASGGATALRVDVAPPERPDARAGGARRRRRRERRATLAGRCRRRARPRRSRNQGLRRHHRRGAGTRCGRLLARWPGAWASGAPGAGRRGPRRLLDLRRASRRSLRTAARCFGCRAGAGTTRPRPLVLLGDVSGSMERYSRMLLHFVHALAAALAARVEAFVFATRLTRVTRQLAPAARSGAVARRRAAVPDWSGGTRIGEALRTFNVAGRGACSATAPVVLLISDGWDRGDPRCCGSEMARLQRSCHRLIWLNPLLGTADYQPLTRGMRAALPFVDDFLPARTCATSRTWRGTSTSARPASAAPPAGRGRRIIGHEIEGTYTSPLPAPRCGRC